MEPSRLVADGLHEFVARALAACGGEDGATRVASLLQDLVHALASRPPSWPEAAPDEHLVHACDRLTVYHVALTPGLSYPPHNHHMAALIGCYAGVETQLLYRRQGAGLVLQGRMEVASPSVARLGPDVIHSVANAQAGRSGAVHVYFGNLIRQPRSRWSADLRDERPFDDGEYQQAVRSIAIQPSGH